MKNYKEIAFLSRGIKPSNSNVPMCEMCGKNRANDIDHIDGRWGKRNIDNRMYDPYNLIIICRECHTNKWGRERKEKAKKIVKSKVIYPDI